MYIVVVGGGKVGYYITKTLLQAEHEVLLVEKDRGQYRRLYDELGEVVFHGDGDEMRVLEEIGVSRSNVFVAATGEDEDNLIACQLAKLKFRCPNVIARVNNPKNEEIFRNLGIDSTVSATTIIYELIEQVMQLPEVIPLLALQKGAIEIVELELPATAPIVGKKFDEVKLPADCAVSAIIRGKEVFVPSATTVYMEGDGVVALVKSSATRDLQKCLIGQPLQQTAN